MPEEPNIFFTTIESGYVAVGDPSLQSEDLNSDSVIDAMKVGTAAYGRTLANGRVGAIIEVRTDTSKNQVPKAYTHIGSLSQPMRIMIESGEVGIADMRTLRQLNGRAMDAKEACIKLHPGVYECQIHMCSNVEIGFMGFIVYLKKVNREEAPNDSIDEVELLG